MPNIPSLSDKAPLKRIRETFDRPKDRDDLIASISRILSLGKVQKLVVEVNQPIRAERLVPQDQEVPEDMKDLEEGHDDWMNIVRNGKLEDFPNRGMSSFQYLFNIFNLVAQKRLKPKIILVHALGEVRSWLELGAFVELTSLFGVEIATHPQVPDDTATLITEDPDDADAEVYCMRLVFDKPKEKPHGTEAGRKEGAGERNRGQGNGRAPGKVGQPS